MTIECEKLLSKNIFLPCATAEVWHLKVCIVINGEKSYPDLDVDWTPMSNSSELFHILQYIYSSLKFIDVIFYHIYRQTCTHTCIVLYSYR